MIATRLRAPGTILLLFLASCGGSATNGSNGAGSPDEQAVMVLGGPSPKTETPKPLAVAAPDEPAPPAVAPARATSPLPDADLAALIRDPRSSRRSPRSTALLNNELRLLEALLSNTPMTAIDRPKIVRRMAEGYVELKYASLRDKQVAEAAFGRSRDSTYRAQILQADAWAALARKKAIEYYAGVVKDYPKFCQTVNPTDPMQNQGCLDEVLYFLSLELEETDKTAARKYYFELIKSYPSSKWIPHAYLAFGEFFFAEALTDPSKWDLAQRSYEEVAKYPPPQNETWGFAHYRLAQVHNAQQDFQPAMQSLVHAIEFSMQYALREAEPLGAAARRGIVPLYVIAGKPSAARLFFKQLSVDADQHATLLDELARAYLKENKTAEAAEFCNSLAGTARVPASCPTAGP